MSFIMWMALAGYGTTGCLIGGNIYARKSRDGKFWDHPGGLVATFLGSLFWPIYLLISIGAGMTNVAIGQEKKKSKAALKAEQERNEFLKELVEANKDEVNEGIRN